MTKLVNSNLCLIDMKHYLNLTLKLCKFIFSDKQITEIKKKMHIDPIYTKMFGMDQKVPSRFARLRF